MNLLSLDDVMAYFSIHAIPFVKPGVSVCRVISGASQATVEAVAVKIHAETPHVDVQVEERSNNTFVVTLVQI